MLSYTEHGKFRALTQVATHNFEAAAALSGRSPLPRWSHAMPAAKWITGLAGEQWAA
jgi:hypothetical protein